MFLFSFVRFWSICSATNFCEWPKASRYPLISGAPLQYGYINHLPEKIFGRTADPLSSSIAEKGGGLFGHAWTKAMGMEAAARQGIT